MPRFSDLFSVRPGVRKGWIGAGFVGFGWLFPVWRTRVGSLTGENAGVFVVCGRNIFVGGGFRDALGAARSGWNDFNAAALRHSLNPLASPGGRLEGIREILRFVHDLTVAELHNAHGVCWPPLVGDGVFRDPEVTFSENSLDVEA